MDLIFGIFLSCVIILACGCTKSHQKSQASAYEMLKTNVMKEKGWESEEWERQLNTKEESIKMSDLDLISLLAQGPCIGSDDKERSSYLPNSDDTYGRLEIGNANELILHVYKFLPEGKSITQLERIVNFATFLRCEEIIDELASNLELNGEPPKLTYKISVINRKFRTSKMNLNVGHAEVFLKTLALDK